MTLLLTAGALLLLLYLFKDKVLPNQKQKCSKCSGQGFWIGTRGDRNTCDICKGTGYIEKAP